MLRAPLHLIFFSLTILLSLQLCTSIQKILGINPKNSQKYDLQGSKFYCFSDPTKSIPFEWVNDNFCDCDLDGSDEPGTSACMQGRFYCLNIHHVARSIPSMRVNDGLCDCCDGSDEYASYTNCNNTCKEKHLEAQLKKNKFAKGWEIKQTWIKLAKRRAAERDTQLPILKKLLLEVDIQVDIQDKNRLKDEKLVADAKLEADNKWEQLFEERERQDAKKMFQYLDNDNNERISSQNIKNAKEFDANNDGIISNEEILTILDLDNDEIKFASPKPPYSNDIQRLVKIAKESSTKYDEEKKKKENILTEIQILEADDSDVNFGKDKEFFPLNGTCFDFKKNRYIYRLCPFDKALQIENGRETKLGEWNEWDGDFEIMMFDNGDGHRCPDTSERFAEVKMKCGDENKIISVEEDFKCHYIFSFRTPAACDQPKEVFQRIGTETHKAKNMGRREYDHPHHSEL